MHIRKRIFLFQLFLKYSYGSYFDMMESHLPLRLLSWKWPVGWAGPSEFFAFPFGHVLQLYAQALRVTSQPLWGSSEYHEALKSLLFYQGLHPARTFLSLSNIRACRSTSSPLFEYGCFIKCEWCDAHLDVRVREDLILRGTQQNFFLPSSKSCQEFIGHVFVKQVSLNSPVIFFFLN